MLAEECAKMTTISPDRAAWDKVAFPPNNDEMYTAEVKTVTNCKPRSREQRQSRYGGVSMRVYALAVVGRHQGRQWSGMSEAVLLIS